MHVDGHAELPLRDGWRALGTDPGACALPGEVPPAGDGWRRTAVPTTAAAVAGVAAGSGGAWLDGQDWWFVRPLRLPRAGPDEEVVLALDGLATLAEVFLDGEPVATSDSMWLAQEVGVTGRCDDGVHELAICCRALGPRLATPRRPRARWRTRLADGNLRWVRTMLLGRMPGVAPGPPAIGPWRPVRLLRRRRWDVDALALRPSLHGSTGRLHVTFTVRPLGGWPPPRVVRAVLDGPTGVHEALLPVALDGRHVSGHVDVPRAATWWPHTHGDPARYRVTLRLEDAHGAAVAAHAGHVGFRTLSAGPGPDHDVERDGLDLHVGGVRVFVRGAVWTPVDPVSLAPDPAAVRATVLAARDAGLNLLRLPGTGAYEDAAFHDLCDELGMLVWQDLMFANLDYPAADPAFAAEVEEEITQVLGTLTGRPSFAVLCGNSEVEQQVAMLGLDPALGRGPLFDAVVPGLLARSGADAVHVRSAPCGGVLPFRPGEGVTNWFAVGGYRRPLAETRRAAVRFASECLALSHVPDDDVLAVAGLDGGVPADAGAEWTFADVRDHYLHELYGVHAAALRAADGEAYLALSRLVSGEVMAEVFGEWRRAASPCGGGIVLWLRDQEAGSGWGLLDVHGRPKVACRVLARVLAPVAVWIVDEGLAGLRVHVANDGPQPLQATLEVALYRDGRTLVEAGATDLRLPARGLVEHDAEAVLGHFADVNHTHRFGPPGHDLVLASLREPGDGRLLSQASFRPLGRSTATAPAREVGLWARAWRGADDAVRVRVGTERVAHGVRVQAPGCVAEEDAFTLAPGGEREVLVRGDAAQLTVSAADVDGVLSIPVEDACP